MDFISVITPQIAVLALVALVLLVVTLVFSIGLRQMRPAHRNVQDQRWLKLHLADHRESIPSHRNRLGRPLTRFRFQIQQHDCGYFLQAPQAERWEANPAPSLVRIKRYAGGADPQLENLIVGI